MVDIYDIWKIGVFCLLEVLIHAYIDDYDIYCCVCIVLVNIHIYIYTYCLSPILHI